MRRPQNVIAVPKEMYRHFAVITLVLTACTAMFADGENRETIARGVQQREAHNRMSRIDRDNVGAKRVALQPGLFDARATGGNGFVRDSGPDDSGSGVSDGGGAVQTYGAVPAIPRPNAPKSQLAASFRPKPKPRGMPDAMYRKYLESMQKSHASPEAGSATREDEARRAAQAAEPSGETDGSAESL